MKLNMILLAALVLGFAGPTAAAPNQPFHGTAQPAGSPWGPQSPPGLGYPRYPAGRPGINTPFDDRPQGYLRPQHRQGYGYPGYRGRGGSGYPGHRQYGNPPGVPGGPQRPE